MPQFQTQRSVRRLHASEAGAAAVAAVAVVEGTMDSASSTPIQVVPQLCWLRRRGTVRERNMRLLRIHCHQLCGGVVVWGPAGFGCISHYHEGDRPS